MLFKPQFAPLVESGAKCQTVRPTPKRMLKSGDRISLRMWTGKPYRSKQRVLRESVIESVQVVRMTDTDMWLDGVRQTGNQNWEFAIADGFTSSREMCNWFADTHGLPFDGVVINLVPNLHKAQRMKLNDARKSEHSKTTIRLYKADAARFIKWVGKCPDFSRGVRMDELIADYIARCETSKFRKRQIICALNYKSKRVVMVKSLAKKSDRVRFSELVRLSGVNGIPKAPSPI